MKPNHQEPVLLNLAIARELVDPYVLEEVLESLQENKIIEDFFIGNTHVKISPSQDRRFDLAMYFAETTNKSGKVDMPDPEPNYPHLPSRRFR